MISVQPYIAELTAAESGTYRFVASTERVDSAGRSLLVSGWELDDFRQNPVMLWDHGLSAALEREPIGTVPQIGTDTFGGKPALIAEVKPASTLSPTAERLWSMVDAGDLKAVSIGATALADPVRDGDTLVYHSQKLDELSLVAVGANSDALRIAASRLERVPVAAPTAALPARAPAHSHAAEIERFRLYHSRS